MTLNQKLIVFGVAVFTFSILKLSSNQDVVAIKTSAKEDTSVPIIQLEKSNSKQIPKNLLLSSQLIGLSSDLAVIDQFNYEYQKEKLINFCHQNSGKCPQFIRENLVKIFEWSIEKSIFLFEVVMEGDDADFSLLNDVISYRPSIEILNSDHHHDDRLQTISMVKSIAIEEFEKKVQKAEVTNEDSEKFKISLAELAQKESDLMIVRDAVSMLVHTYGLDKEDVWHLVQNRGEEDLVAYEDFL